MPPIDLEALAREHYNSLPPRSGSDESNIEMLASFAKQVVRQDFSKHLEAHWLTSLEYAHTSKTDSALCYCGWRGDHLGSVGAAVKSWVEHVVCEFGLVEATKEKHES